MYILYILLIYKNLAHIPMVSIFRLQKNFYRLIEIFIKCSGNLSISFKCPIMLNLSTPMFITICECFFGELFVR